MSSTKNEKISICILVDFDECIDSHAFIWRDAAVRLQNIPHGGVLIEHIDPNRVEYYYELRNCYSQYSTAIFYMEQLMIGNSRWPSDFQHRIEINKSKMLDEYYGI